MTPDISHLSAAQEHAASIEKLARSSQAKLKSFLRRFERDFDLLDDLVQEVYIEALKSLASFSGRSSIETWLFGVAANVGRRHVERCVAYRAVFCAMDSVTEEQQESQRTHNMVDQLIAGEEIGCIETTVSRMPIALGATFDALFRDHLTYEEAAKSMGVPIGTVRSRASRVRELLCHARER